MAENTIQLKGEFSRDERAAGGAVTPGHLVELNSSDKYVVHSTGAGPHGRAFAVENELEGKTITEAYVLDERIQVNYQLPGNEVNAILAATEDIAIGAFLQSAGDGTLEALSGTDRQPVGIALAALDLSASGAVDTLLAIKIV